MNKELLVGFSRKIGTSCVFSAFPEKSGQVVARKKINHNKV
jgi:hypothetical protein